MRKNRKTNTMARLGALLRHAVETGRVSVPKIVERSGVERSLVYKYMREQQAGCTVDTLERLMKAIGSHPSEVFGEREREPDWVIESLERLLDRAKGDRGR